LSPLSRPWPWVTFIPKIVTQATLKQVLDINNLLLDDIYQGESLRRKCNHFFFFLEQTQFVVVVIYIINALRIDCGYSRNQLYITWVYCITLIILFGKFYIQSYINKSDSNGNNNNQKKSEWMTWHILLVSSCIKVWWENQLPFIWVQVVLIVTRCRQRKIGVCFLVKSSFLEIDSHSVIQFGSEIYTS